MVASKSIASSKLVSSNRKQKNYRISGLVLKIKFCISICQPNRYRWKDLRFASFELESSVVNGMWKPNFVRNTMVKFNHQLIWIWNSAMQSLHFCCRWVISEPGIQTPLLAQQFWLKSFEWKRRVERGEHWKAIRASNLRLPIGSSNVLEPIVVLSAGMVERRRQSRFQQVGICSWNLQSEFAVRTGSQNGRTHS